MDGDDAEVSSNWLSDLTCVSGLKVSHSVSQS